MRRHGRICRVLVDEGTAQGQMMFWDATLRRWVHTEITEMFWNDVAKRLGIKNSDPTSELDVTGTVAMTRLLAGGVTE